MKQLMLTLLEAQKSLLTLPGGSPENSRIIERLRATVPAPILAHFLRLVAQHRRGVAEVRNGVCAQCHIRLPSSLAAVVASSDDIHVCEQCGSFLVQVGDPVTPHVPSVAPKVPRARRVSRALAA